MSWNLGWSEESLKKLQVWGVKNFNLDWVIEPIDKKVGVEMSWRNREKKLEIH